MYSSPSASRTASPRPGHATPAQLNTAIDSSTRPMQVKVLYTLDDLNKTNCLARCPQPLLIQTAYLDGSTQIGIVELGTCIQAITTASPELLAKIGQDFTVYAYDYSEYETPQVGQGLLSAIFASTSSTPMAPAIQSKTMVTGRVCKNVLGLFSDGVKETLEVKLRLVPVPTCLQNEYLASMEKYRDPSHLLTENFDAQVWTSFLRENPNFGAPINQEIPPFLANDLNNFRANEAQVAPEQPLSIGDRQTVAPASAERSAPVTHSSFVMYGTPDQVANSRPKTPSQQQRPSRPSSRASNKARPALRKSESCAPRVENARVQDGSDADEGPSRKRAKITKTDWRGPSAFDSNEESLRVAASSAASIRGHRPIGGLIAAENPVRPPTPRPKAGPRQRKAQSLLRSSTALSHSAMTRHDGSYQSPYADIDSDAAMTSPEGQSPSVTSTPQDIPSSPPVMRHVSPTPSSPQLPVLPNHFDSGFVSGTIDECLDDDEADRPINDDLRMTTQYNQNSNALTSDVFVDGTPVNEQPLPPKFMPRPQPVRRMTPKPSMPSTPSLPNEDSKTIEIEPAKIDGAESGPTRRPEAEKRPRRADSAANEVSSRPASPVASEGPTRARRGSGIGFNKRQKQIRDKLHASIAAGEAPPHCENCGEIDTPTWRKAFARVEEGPPPDFKLPQVSKPARISDYDDNDGIVTCEPYERDEDGNVTSHRIFKKSIQPEEMSVYEELRLCNPCGIWLFKNRQMRPHERWSKQTDGEGGSTSKSKSRKKPALPKTTEPQSDCDERQQSELPMPEDVDNVPPQSGPIDTNIAIGKQQTRTPAITRPIACNEVNLKERSTSIGTLDKVAAETALRKAIQSSPPKFPGSSQSPTKAPGSKHSPINLEDDPSKDATRRLLFPSPRKPGEVKSLENSPSTTKSGHKHPPLNANAAPPFIPYQQEKENFPPNLSSDHGHRSIHNSDGQTSTLSADSPKHTNLLQTPPSNKGNKALTPNPYLSGTTRRWMNAFSSSSPSNIDGQMTPFTAQLTQLLSEANNQTPSRGLHNLSVFGLGAESNDVDGLFAFSDINTDDLSSDFAIPPMLMPGSPTPRSTQGQATFGLYEDGVDGLEA